jgi:uncharacterized YigZ family protein
MDRDDPESGRSSCGRPEEAGVFTLAAPVSAEIKIQRSRFVAAASPADGAAAAELFVAEVARNHHAARHVCYAWRLGRAPELAEARHDAGEPAGTAGEPILAALRRAGLQDCVLAVARYFGGIKLGTGGLARAYAAAADAAIAAGERLRIEYGRLVALQCAYEQVPTVLHLLERCAGRIEQQDFGATVTWQVWLPQRSWDRFAAQLAEATRGAVQPTIAAENARRTSPVG